MQRKHTMMVLLAALILTGLTACYNKPSDAPPASQSAAPAAGGHEGMAMPSAGGETLSAAADSKAASPVTEGNGHYGQGHYDVAAGWYEDALKADPNSAEAHYNLGLALDKMGRHEEAAVHFEEAKRLGGNNPAIANSEILKKHVGM